MSDPIDLSHLPQPSRPRLGARPFTGPQARRPSWSPPTIVALPRPVITPSPRPQTPEADDAAEGPGEAMERTWQSPIPESLDSVRALLDAELAHFHMKASELPPPEAPFPEFNAAPNAEPAASEVVQPGLFGDDVGMVRAGTDTLSAPASPGAEPSASEVVTAALADVMAEAARVAEAAAAAEMLDSVARRVRSGEIVLAQGACAGGPAAVLAAVLASMLGVRE
jgi:hypothetical protein